jgi:hypothetical protein
MNELARIPQALPIQNTEVVVPVARPVGPAAGQSASHGALVGRRTDGFAVASAICGFTAIVPFVSQVIGLALGVLSLSRIRRARRHGLEIGGTRWAVAGIASSGFVLICWIGIIVALNLVSSTFAHSADSLGAVLQTTP